MSEQVMPPIMLHIRLTTGREVFVSGAEARELRTALNELFTEAPGQPYPVYIPVSTLNPQPHPDWWWTPVTTGPPPWTGTSCAAHQEMKGNEWNGTEWVKKSANTPTG